MSLVLPLPGWASGSKHNGAGLGSRHSQTCHSEHSEAATQNVSCCSAVSPAHTLRWHTLNAHSLIKHHTVTCHIISKAANASCLIHSMLSHSQQSVQGWEVSAERSLLCAAVARWTHLWNHRRRPHTGMFISWIVSFSVSLSFCGKVEIYLSEYNSELEVTTSTTKMTEYTFIHNLSSLTQIAQIVKREMESAVKLYVKLKAKVKVGPSWGNLQDLDL